MGVLASALLATIALRAPLLLGGALTVALGATLVLVMPELNLRPARGALLIGADRPRGALEPSSFAPVLWLCVAFAGMSSAGFDRLWEAHFLNDLGLPRVAGWTRATPTWLRVPSRP